MPNRPDWDVLVVGGGLAGLTAGVALADRGLRVIVLERDRHLGGRAASWCEHGDVVDIGPHVLLSEYRNFPALLARLGTAGQVTWQPRTVLTLGLSTGPYALRHHPLPTPMSLLPDFLRAPGLSMRDLVSNVRPTWRALRYRPADNGELDAITAEAYLRSQGTTQAMMDWFWKLAAMAVMNTPLESCSAAALIRMHGMLIGHRGTHFGFPAVALAALYEAQARQAIESQGGRVISGAGVQYLASESSAHSVSLRNGASFRASHCIVAIPPAELSRLRSGLVEHQAFEPSPYVSSYLWFDRSITQEKFWALPWTPTRMNYDFYDLANIRPAMAGRPSLIACNFICCHRAAQMSDGELVEAAVAEIAEFAPAVREARLLNAAVHRIPMAIPCPLPGVEGKRPAARTAVPRLFLAGDWTNTGLPCSMESACFSGYRAAEEVLGDLGRAEKLAMPPRRNDGLAALIQP